jgi:DNA-binding transcriptional MerR regulator
LGRERACSGPVERTDGDTRRYTPEQLDKARIIAAAQFGGWTLEEIQGMLAEWGPSPTKQSSRGWPIKPWLRLAWANSFPGRRRKVRAVEFDL